MIDFLKQIGKRRGRFKGLDDESHWLKRFLLGETELNLQLVMRFVSCRGRHVINETGVWCLLRQGTVQTGDEDCAAV